MKKKAFFKTFAGETILLLLTLVMLIPVYYFMIGAFKGRMDIVKFPLEINWEMIKKVGLSNFTYAFEKIKMLQALKNTGTITITALAIVVICGSLAGFVIARVDRKIFRVFYTVLIALMVVPFIGCVIPIVIQSTQLGTYNTLWGAILIQAAWNLPFAVFLYAGFMKALPKELEEAVKIDGGGHMTTFFRVMLPLALPSIGTLAIFCLQGTWEEFFSAKVILGAVANQITLPVMIQSLKGAHATRWEWIFSASILAQIPMILLFAVFQKRFVVSGLSDGSVKA